MIAVSRRAGWCEPSESLSLNSRHARLGFWLVVSAVIVAHGCHRGDHDDEPLFVPVEERVLSQDSGGDPEFPISSTCGKPRLD